MKHYFLVLTLIFMSENSSAAEKHVHGAADLSIAFEGTTGKIEFNAANEGLFGFEHKATSEADKKTLQEGMEKLEKNITEMITFDSNLGCQISKEKIDIHSESKHHSHTEASFLVTCSKSPASTELRFHFQKHFPRLKQIETQIIIDELQKSLKIKTNNQAIILK